MSDTRKPFQGGNKNGNKKPGGMNRGGKPSFAKGGMSKGNGEAHPQGGSHSQGGSHPQSGPRVQGGKPAGKPGFGRPQSGPRPQNGSHPQGGSRPQSGSHPQRREEPRMSTLTARRVALDTLLDVTVQDAYASLALDKRLNAGVSLSERDKRLCTELVYGTLENRIRIDYMIDQFLTDPNVDKIVREVLRMGVYQLFFLDRVPDMAAVDESVKLTRSMGLESLTGLVNAVLRNMLRRKEEIAFPKSADDPVKYLSVMFSMPEVLVKRFIEAYGEQQALEIVRYRPKTHDTTLRITTGHMTEAEMEAFLEKQEIPFERGIVPGMYRLSRPGDLPQSFAYRNGLFSIQGESSVLAAQAVGVRPGMNVLDACAAPGGKTAVLAEAMDDTGRILAWDKHEHRVALIRAMTQRLGLDNVRPAVRDAQVLREEMIRTQDAVLIDAPCSGTGVMLSKPDVKYRVSEKSLAELTDTQREILESCSAYVKRGGVLVYSTCSILPEENALMVRAFLEKHPEFKLEGLEARLPESLRGRVEDGMLQLLPHRDHLEGFFIARMVRKD